MSTLSIEELARSARADPTDTQVAIALLAARSRCGHISVEMIRAAADLGHPSAMAMTCIFPRSELWSAWPGRHRYISLLDQSNISLFAADCAQRALPIFEGICPGDKRLINALESIRTGKDIDNARMVAHAAATYQHVAAHISRSEYLGKSAAAHAASAAAIAVDAAIANHPIEAVDAAQKCLAQAIAAIAMDARAQASRIHEQKVDTYDIVKIAGDRANGRERQWQMLRLAAYILAEVPDDHR